LNKFNIIFFHLELTEFPKIDASDESEDEIKQDNEDEMLSNSISSVSMDGLSLNNTTNNNSGMSNIQQTSDYESFADCMRQSPIIAATANIAKPLTNINLDNRFSIQSPLRMNREGSSVSSDYQRRRKNGTSVIHKNGKTTNNETPLLSHLFGTQKTASDSNI
jgi:hypothetical protein